MPANEFQWEAGVEDGAGGFGITPDVVFSGGSYIAFAAGSTSQDYAAADELGKTGLALEGNCQIRERAKSDEDKAGIPPSGLNHGVGCWEVFDGASRGRVIVISETVFAVEPTGVFERAGEGTRRTFY